MTKEWEVFEKSVAAFLQALEPRATVSHDVRLPDKHSGALRQRDVWIETSFGGHIPILILVSCKRKNSRLDQQDVDAFVGELGSSSANVGVLYSYSGFTDHALTKAKALGISCCSLYENEAPHVPEALNFVAFCNTENARLSISRDLTAELSRLNDLFDLPVTSEDRQSVLKALVKIHDSNRVELLKNISVNSPLLPSWTSCLNLSHSRLSAPVDLSLIGGWNLYRAKVESYRLNGSYSFTNGDFKGLLSTPYVDRQSSHRGPGWELVDRELPSMKNMMSFIMHGSDLEKRIREVFGNMSFQEWTSSMRERNGNGDVSSNKESER